MRVGLTIHEDAKLCVPEITKKAGGETYPKTADAALKQLRRMGYLVPSVEALKNLVRERYGRRIIKTPDEGKAKWTPELIQQAADHFEANRAFTPLAALCADYGTTFKALLVSLHEVYREALEQYGTQALMVIGDKPDEVHFTLHAERDRNEGEKGRVWFTLRDDVRKQLTKATK